MLPTRLRIATVPSCQRLKFQVDAFRRDWLAAGKPVKYDNETYRILNTVPALKTWSSQAAVHHAKPEAPFPLNYDYLNQHGDLAVPIERTLWANAPPHDNLRSTKRTVQQFDRFEAPLSVFLDWTKRKLKDPSGFCPNESQYIAQCSIPAVFEADLPAPAYVSVVKDSEAPDVHGGRLRPPEGTSLWMGIPPTETPLHKDPNDNFFVQVAGRKTIRLVRPDAGYMLLEQVKRELAQRLGRRTMHGPSFRGEEMMVGPERDIMSYLLWGLPSASSITKGRGSVDVQASGSEGDTFSEAPVDTEGTNEDLNAANAIVPAHEDASGELSVFETTLGPGDGLFIPKGWYHTVRSVGDHTNGINISANWWFRATVSTAKKMGARPI